jgi:hemerythrin-like domain-containing protein
MLMGRALEAVKAHHNEIREKVENFTGRLMDLKKFMVPCESQGMGAWFLDVDRAMDIRVVREYADFLKKELVPHAEGEERALYPRVRGLLGDAGLFVNSMTMEHTAIRKYVEALTLQASLDQHDFEQVLQAVLELRAVLKLHLAKEEQLMLPFLETRLSDEEQEAMLAELHGSESSA